MPRTAKPTPQKSCEICGITLTRKRFNGVLEDYSAFIRRKFCSLSCSNSRSKGGKSETRMRVAAQKLIGESCECCGSSMNLHAHHVNGDWSDNRVENIQTLCESCHHSWHSRHLVHGLRPLLRMPPSSRHSRILCQETEPLKTRPSCGDVQAAIVRGD